MIKKHKIELVGIVAFKWFPRMLINLIIPRIILDINGEEHRLLPNTKIYIKKNEIEIW